MKEARSTANEGDWHSSQFDSLLSRYRSTGEPIAVNFRKLVPFNSGVDRYTHLIHPYPAKLLLNIPYFFLRCDQLTSSKGLVLDPFCGSGTVLLEALISGRDAVGADANPLARLITRSKTTPISRTRIEKAYEKLSRSARLGARKQEPDVVNIDHWFSKSAIQALANIRNAIDQIEASDLRRFFQTCFSATVRKVSYADPRNAVPVRISPERARMLGLNGWSTQPTIDVDNVFKSIVTSNTRRLARLYDHKSDGKIHPLSVDARSIDVPRGRRKVDLIITSPPYTGAQKYIRASSLSIGWLGFAPSKGLRGLEDQNIGREHYKKSDVGTCRSPIRLAQPLLEEIATTNPLRAHIASNYLLEMRTAIIESYRVLSPGGHMVLIAGANIICGKAFDTPSLLERIAHNAGFRTVLKLSDDIRSRGLMTKRNRTAGIISSEIVFVLRKPS